MLSLNTEKRICLIKGLQSKIEKETELSVQYLERASEHGAQVLVDCGKGWKISVVLHDISYGSDKNKFELAVFRNNDIHYNNPVADGDVRGHLTSDEVIALIKELVEYIKV